MYWHWRAGVKETMPLPSGVWLWMKKGGARPLVREGLVLCVHVSVLMPTPGY